MTTTAPVPFRRKFAWGGLAFKTVVVLAYLFLLAPLLIVFVISFSSNRYLSFPPEGFTFEWYQALPQQTQFIEGLQTSLLTASITTVIVLLIAVPATLAIDRYDFAGKAALSGLFLSPLLVPTIVLALGLVLVLGPLGLTNTYTSIVIGHIAITVPYVVRTTLMALQTSDTSCEEAARVLGANGTTVFWRVTLPIIRPGVIAGAVMAFIVSFDEAVISLFVAESGRPTLPVHVLRYVENSADAVVAALSVILILFSILIVVIVERVVGLKNAL
ncbi:MAG: ABC transporter permease [Candidatus Microbacterium stercoravium]|uniref:ABC transporter permease n=1 Tax=Candidatus Microbacterium stercoravium TaxID=2838697 RepID=A0A9D2KG65_9MICO|nr:ABC transporter permease [Candidatus Microbacterium stercoravium]